METPAPGCARGATPAALSASGAERTAAGAALQVCSTSRRRDGVSCPVPRDATVPATAGAASRATPAAEPAQVAPPTTNGSASCVDFNKPGGGQIRPSWSLLCAPPGPEPVNALSHTSTFLTS